MWVTTLVLSATFGGSDLGPKRREGKCRTSDWWHSSRWRETVGVGEESKSNELSDKKEAVNRPSTLADSSGGTPAAPPSFKGVGHKDELESTTLRKLLGLGALVWVFLGSEVAEECQATPAEAVVLHG